MAYAMRESTKRKIRAALKKNREAKKLLKEPVNSAYLADQLLDAGGSQQSMIPVVDVRAREERAFRNGLVTAMECILRGLR